MSSQNNYKILKKTSSNKYDMIYIDDDSIWQKPVITEYQIFQNIFKEKLIPFNYVAFPWANYIDNEWTKKYNNLVDTIDLECNNHTFIENDKVYFTVVQHINFRKYINTFIKLNIKYIFTPHKMPSDNLIENEYGISILPISLFPKQSNSKNIFKSLNSKKYLASFIGQVIHEHNISDIREKIYNNFKHKKDCFIRKNDEWFYQKEVYNITNNGISNHTIDNDEQYKNNMVETIFSLCPSGTGPNSIRLWEALSFGSIPVILSDSMIMPDVNIDFKDFCIFWKEDNIDNLYNYLVNISRDKINNMSQKCIDMYNLYFNEKNMHKVILNYFDKIYNKDKIIKNIENVSECKDTICEKNNDTKIILITQYYKVEYGDTNYKMDRQKEIDYCLQKNFDNKYIDEIHLLLEDEIDINFINNIYNKKIIKYIIGKRINYKDVFDYYNKYLNNNICILINSDIYLDESIHIVNNINFDLEKIFISLNRYENNNDNLPALLNGLEVDYVKQYGVKYLTPYQESIWSQDAWIWKYNIDNIDNKFEFNLGTNGCDNHINYLMNNNGYKVLNCSHLICVNHYDKLSIVVHDFGITKGNISKAKENKIGTLETFLFLNNQNDIPDKYTTEITKIITHDHKTRKNNLIFKKNISEIDMFDYLISSSSDSNDNYLAKNVLFKNKNYWEPKKDDTNSWIKFMFDNIYEISVIDIKGKYVNRHDLNNGYVTKFKISYTLDNNNWIEDNTIYNAINVNNGNYIKKIYLDNHIKCIAIKIFPLEYHNICALKIKLYHINNPKINIFNILCNNPNYYHNFNSTYFDYSDIYKNLPNNIIKDFRDNSIFSYTNNILNQEIKEGICIFTYVMNRNNNIYNNINTWLKQKIDQLIILDWNSKENMIDFINKLNDKRILYVNVIDENAFIRTFAQNLAARLCKYDKILKIDSDIILKDNFFETHELNRNDFYVGEWRCARDSNEKYLHGNIYLFLVDYFRVNGYNEFIKDYGWDDSDFTIRLMACGLNKKVFNYDYMYHVPHNEETRIVNLNTNYEQYKNLSLLMTMVNKKCLENIVWNNEYKLQKFSLEKINDNYIICDRIKNNEYSFNKDIKDKIIIDTYDIIKNWKIT